LFLASPCSRFFDCPELEKCNNIRGVRRARLCSVPSCFVSTKRREIGIIGPRKGECLSAQHTSAGPKQDLQLEIAHLLLIDVVGYSKLLVNEQIDLLRELNHIVRNTNRFRAAEAAGKLIRLPTGDGMALLFFNSPEEPVQCALEISQALRDFPHIQLRMGVHSGPINQITDVNDRSNVAGAGINVAQRVVDCADAGHILLSKHLADDLAQYRHWQPYLHDVGECEVKHGLRLHIVNLYKDGLGNPQLPKKLKRGRRWKPTADGAIRPVRAPRGPKFALVAALLLSTLALAISFSIFFRRASPAAKHPPSEASLPASIPKNSIAVLPFENLTDDKQNAYLADGIMDEILNDLAKVADLKVISRTSVMQYRAGDRRNLREIAAGLGVAHVLEGSVQRSGDRIRVSAQLIDARTDAHMWAQRYDRQLADVFAIETELAEAIVAQLKSKLSTEEKAAIEVQPTADLAAYDLYVRAKTLLAASVSTLGKENRLEAVRLLDQARSRDPGFLLAYCTLSRVHSELFLLGMDHTRSRLDQAEAALHAAFRLRPNAGEAHLAAAFLLYCTLDYDRARQELQVAQRALPNEPLVFEISGYIDRRQGRWEESAHNLGRALELDPRNFYFLQQMSQSYEKLRQFDDMRIVMDRALAVVPADPGARMNRATIDFLARADTKRLRATLDAIMKENPKTREALAVELIELALCERDFAAAQRALADMSAAGGSEEAFVYPRAWYAGLIARASGDVSAARAAFSSARAEVIKAVEEQSNYAQPFSVLGMIDAALGNKDQAINEAIHATELLPITKDAINGPLITEHLAITYAWCGEKDRAIEQLAIVTSVPSDVNYGRLRLDPSWDSLRSDPRFQKVVESLAPK
jgi:TolB-like protein/class 3 adenylate cyclase/Tfp pilus assembly protein PilF